MKYYISWTVNTQHNDFDFLKKKRYVLYNQQKTSLPKEINISANTNQVNQTQ